MFLEFLDRKYCFEDVLLIGCILEGLGFCEWFFVWGDVFFFLFLYFGFLLFFVEVVGSVWFFMFFFCFGVVVVEICFIIFVDIFGLVIVLFDVILFKVLCFFLVFNFLDFIRISFLVCFVKKFWLLLFLFVFKLELFLFFFLFFWVNIEEGVRVFVGIILVLKG